MRRSASIATLAAVHRGAPFWWALYLITALLLTAPKRLFMTAQAPRVIWVLCLIVWLRQAPLLVRPGLLIRLTWVALMPWAVGFTGAAVICRCLVMDDIIFQPC